MWPVYALWVTLFKLFSHYFQHDSGNTHKTWTIKCANPLCILYWPTTEEEGVWAQRAPAKLFRNSQI